MTGPPCDAALVGAGPHACRPHGFWRLRSPAGRVYSLCSTTCLGVLLDPRP
jgi:hypothetical protein